MIGGFQCTEILNRLLQDIAARIAWTFSKAYPPTKVLHYLCMMRTTCLADIPMQQPCYPRPCCPHSCCSHISIKRLPTHRSRLALRLLVGVLLAGFLAACSKPEIYLLAGNTMGTTYSVKVVAKDGADKPELKDLQPIIEARLNVINQLMSTYIPDSELSRLNKSQVGEYFPLSEENLYLLDIAGRVYAMSDGKLDVTVGPLVNLWGFGPDSVKTRAPVASRIKAASDKVGFDKLKIDTYGITRSVAGFVDLSALAKGYAVDEIARLLDQLGQKHYLVEIGGELKAKGFNHLGQQWRIAVEKPDVLSREIFTVLPLENMGMATSGDYRNYFEVDGKRFSHIIDPDTGYPITNRLASVTVLFETTAVADALATAISVMGEASGLAMAEQHRLLVFVIIKTADGFEAKYSSAFRDYLARVRQ